MTRGSARVAFVCIALVCGCGSDSEDEEMRPPAPRPAGESSAPAETPPAGAPDETADPPDPVFRAQATEVCERARRGRAPLARPRAGPALARYAAEALPVSRAMTKGLRPLEPPRGEEGEAFSRLRAGLAALTAVYERTADARGRGRAAVAQVIPGLEQQAERDAEAAGLPLCGPPSSG